MPNDNNKFNDKTTTKTETAKRTKTGATKIKTKTETTTKTSYTQHHAAALVPHGTVYEDALPSQDGQGDG